MSSTDPRRPARRRPLAAALAAPICALAAAGCSDAPIGTADRAPALYSANADNLRLMTGGPMTARELANLGLSFRAAAPDTVTFAFDSAALDADAQAAVDRQARWLRANPGALMRVEGHADLVGSERYNDRIGLRRAEAVATRLAALGVDPSRLTVLQSFGESVPVVPVEARERRNRRAVVIVAGHGRPAPGDGFDGKRAALAYEAYVTDQSEQVVLDSASGMQ